MGKFAPARCKLPPAARQCQLLNAEIVGGEVPSHCTTSLSAFRKAEGCPNQSRFIFSDCSPAAGTRAAFDFTDRRHVPLGNSARKLRQFHGCCEGSMSSLGPSCHLTRFSDMSDNWGKTEVAGSRSKRRASGIGAKRKSAKRRSCIQDL